MDVLGINTDGVISTFSQSNLVTFPDSIAQYVGGVGNIDLADINRDGYIDIYLNGSASSKVYLNNAGTFSVSNNWAPSIIYLTVLVNGGMLTWMALWICSLWV